MVAQKIKIYSFNLLLQKQIAHVNQDVADPNLLYLHYGQSAFDIGLVQDIEVEWALKYLNWEKKGGTMTNKFNVDGHWFLT